MIQAVETTQPHLNKTELKDRTLWFDGDSSYPTSSVFRQALISNADVFANDLNQEIKKYNNLQPTEKQIKLKTTVKPLSFEWIIPEEFKSININEYLNERLFEQYDSNPNWTDDDVAKRAVRVSRELRLFKKHALNDVLRVLIFVINTLHNKSVVWGVGRGSSVSSYVLYLIGIHDVDSVEYDLDIADFLH